MGTPDHSLRFRIYEVEAEDGPTVGALIGELTKVWGKQIRKEFNELGAGDFYINRHDDQAAWCVIDSTAPKRYVKAYLDDFSGDPVFGFFLTDAEIVAASEDEHGGETVHIGGPGPLSILRTAIVHPTAYTNTDSSSQVWASTATSTWEWTNVALGGPLIRQVEEAKARGGLPDVTVDFSRTVDSNGDDWDMTFDFSVDVGTNLWDMVTELQKGGLIVDMDPDDFTLHAYAEFGTDLSDDVAFVYGVNIRGEHTASKNVEADGGGSWALVPGRTVASGAGTWVVVDEVDERGIGHVEITGQQINTARVAYLERYGHRLIRKAMNKYDGSATIGVVESQSGKVFASPYDKRALIDYVPGDTVSLDIPGVYDEQTPQVIAITIVETKGGEYDPIVELAYIDAGTGPGTVVTPPTGPWVPCPPTTPTGVAPNIVQEIVATNTMAGSLETTAPPNPGDTIVWTVWQFGATGTPPASGNGWTRADWCIAGDSGDGHNTGMVAVYYRVVEEGDDGNYAEPDTQLPRNGDVPAWAGIGWLVEYDQTLAPSDTATEDDQPGSTNLDAGLVTPTADGTLALVGGYIQYNGLTVDSTAPDADLTEVIDRGSNSFSGGTDFRWAWGARREVASASGGYTVAGTSSVAGVWAGVVVAFSGAGSDGGSDCPPPIPGQHVAPLEIEVPAGCTQTLFRTPYPYVPGTLKVYIRNSLGELVFVPVTETDPDDGWFTTPYAPCRRIITDRYILTGRESPTGNFLVLTDGAGVVLTGYGVDTTIEGSLLVVEFDAASSQETEPEEPPSPPTPTDPPPGPVTPPPVPSGSYPPETAIVSVAVPSVTAPALGATIVDPVWGTHIRRIGTGKRHDYARHQPWSKGDTLMWLPYGNVIVDYATLATVNTGPVSDLLWSNTETDICYGGEGTSNVLKKVNGRTDATIWSKTYTGYTALRSGNGEGRQDRSDHYLALQGFRSGTNVVLVVDLQTGGTVVASKDLGYTPNNVSMSWSGNYVLINGVGNGVFAWDWSADTTRTLSGFGQHGDVVGDTDGSDWYVQSDDQVDAWRMSDGLHRSLFPSSTVFSESHVSGTNIHRPGWVYLSVYNGNHTGLGQDQVLAVKLDGSGTVNVFAHAHHGADVSFETQPQAAANRDGTKVAFASEWGGGTYNGFVASV